ncbi:MAG: hypothetical protein IIW20_02385 [Clostridia bacterium]|nr:hypothetical protein [Clostridia bacterium]
MKKSKKIAISAILSALSVVVIYLGSVFEVLDLSAAAIASIAIIFAQIELKSPYPYLIYATTSTLALLLIPSKFSALLYVLMGGLYPLVKQPVERLRKTPKILMKTACFLLIMTISAFLLVFVFLLPVGELLSLYYVGVFLVCAVTFFLYDYALNVMIAFYFHRLRKKIKKFLN